MFNKLHTSKFIVFCFFLASVFIVPSCNNSAEAEEATPAASTPEEALGWKLGAQAYTFNLFSFAEALDKIDSCQLRYVEAFPGQQIGGGIEGKMDFTMSEDTRAKVLQLLKDKGIQLYAYGVVNPDTEEGWKQLFEFGKAMGIQTFTSEPAAAFLPLISRLCDEYQINVAIHNHPTPRNYWKPEMVLAAMEGQSSRIGACADVGHWVRSDLDPIECLKKLDGRILHLHMKDLAPLEGKDKGADNRDVHWGTGVAKTDEVIAELKRQNFKGMLSAEYEANWENNVPDVRASVEYFRKALEK